MDSEQCRADANNRPCHRRVPAARFMVNRIGLVGGQRIRTQPLRGTGMFVSKPFSGQPLQETAASCGG
jgi:hypothetical protein